MKDVELVYDAGCPNVETARDQLRRAFEEAKLPAFWREWIRGDPTNPPRVERYGSPTILVDGEDVAPGDVAEGSCCRVYADPRGALRGVPDLQVIVSALVRTSKGP
jgi:hypothetical protein